jgi:hypothetical protein
MTSRSPQFTGMLATALLALGVATSGGAQAGTLSVSDIFGQFNAVVLGNFATTADVEGRTVVGGNLTGGATFALNPVGVAASSFSALTVYGSGTGGGTYNINHAGGVTIGGSNNASFTLNGGGSAFVGGANSGNLSLTNGAGSLYVVGANSGTLQLASGGSVYVGGTAGGISVGGPTTVSINGNTSGNVNLNGGGTVALAGSNSGVISLSGGSVV